MTINTSRDTKLTVDEIVLLAYQLCGRLDATATTQEGDNPQLMAVGRKLLDMVVKQLGSTYRPARHVAVEYVTMVVDQQDYVLDESILDVVGDGKYIGPDYAADPDAAEGEVRVTRVGRETFYSQSDHGSSGYPYLMFPDRGGDDYQITLRVYQRPSEAGLIRLQTHKAAADSTGGSSTVDLESTYNEFLITKLAGLLVAGSNQERSKQLLAMAADLKPEAREAGSDHSPVPTTITIRPAQHR